MEDLVKLEEELKQIKTKLSELQTQHNDLTTRGVEIQGIIKYLNSKKG